MNFFSILIPAHNEEKYIAETLVSMGALNYSKDFFEVLVIENGSTDRTLEVAKKFESGNIRVMISEKGASKAKNFGLKNMSAKSDWAVFLDADTLLKPEFLADLNAYITARADKNLTIGTTTVLPQGRKRLKADAWFAFYNIGHALTHTSFAIQIMKAALRSKIRFDEVRKFAEDLKLIEDLRREGKFFYFRTKTVWTSTRRFDEVGWFRLFIKWNWQALVLAKTQKKDDEYDVIR